MSIGRKMAIGLAGVLCLAGSYQFGKLQQQGKTFGLLTNMAYLAKIQNKRINEYKEKVGLQEKLLELQRDTLEYTTAAGNGMSNHIDLLKESTTNLVNALGYAEGTLSLTRQFSAPQHVTLSEGASNIIIRNGLSEQFIFSRNAQGSYYFDHMTNHAFQRPSKSY